MGLTKSSVGHSLGIEQTLNLQEHEVLVAFAGSPNVGKSTLFNLVTGLRQHTGNWSGKTVGTAYGRAEYLGKSFVFADTPGAYSLAASSAEEELARDFICFSPSQKVVVICDATSMPRGLMLALQVMEAHSEVVICVNMLDEATKMKTTPDLTALSEELGVPVVGTVAATGLGKNALLEALHKRSKLKPKPLVYDADIEAAIASIIRGLGNALPESCARFVAISLLCGDESAEESFAEELCIPPKTIEIARNSAIALLTQTKSISDRISIALNMRSSEINERICLSTAERSRGADRFLTHKFWGIPLMAMLLTGTLWLTIEGANVPSAMLSSLLFSLGDYLRGAMDFLPEYLSSALFDGVWCTTAWVTAVMLPPMAIFFPIFTLLEDIGYLPRVAFNLDGMFQRAHACGKQGLTMCMGFGCNAAGVIGCRIIDSPRERMIAILTNAFVPCNGRFPALIAVISIFFASSSLGGALLLALIITLGVALTLLCSWLLSVTILRGVPSSFTLELPPYRKPDIGSIIVRSIVDRTIFVLGRALLVAAPTGLFIWILTQLGALEPLANFLDPLGKFMGLDGIILLAFVLGLPANEIVVPIILMCVLSQTTLTDYSSLSELGSILLSAGWTAKTALCFLVFNLLHSPCSTTLLTIKKETGKWRWAMLSAVLPVMFGFVICVAINFIM